MRLLISVGVGLMLASVGAAADPDRTALAQQAQKVFTTHCYRCHGQDGVFEGGFNYLLDPAKLVARKKVVPGKPDESPLLQRMVKGTMPPADVSSRPSDADKAVVRQWIAAGAPTFSIAAPSRTVITQTDLERWMLADLETLDRRARRFVRYFSLAHLSNQGLSDDELQTYRNALAKLLNSLSWHPRVTVPLAVDPHKILLRIDLRWYMWDAGLWNRVLAEYPYGILNEGASARAVMVGTATKLPLVRADWFIATACRPPLYYDLLQMPGSLAELERLLRVDATINIQQERVARAGFNGSGVSKNNRILERHDSIHGAYWRTYDFDAVPQNLIDRGGPPDQRNIFAFPLGPAGVFPATPFQQAGGEAIFSLPNGLHGFMLVNAVGARVDKAPVQIVSDPKRPDRAVEAGVSCMSCHLTGINPKNDQVRDYVGKHAAAFSRADADLIRALYPPDAKMKQLMEADAERYRLAVAQTGARVTKTEPVSTLTLRYEADLDLTVAASEIGLAPEEVKARVAASDALARNLGPLGVAGGTIARQVFVQAFADVVRELRLGVLFASNANGGTLPDNTGELDPLESAAGTTNHAAITRDGKLALLASGDRSVRLYDVAAGRDVRRFVGHTASVWSVAFSADEKQALSGSMDGTLRHWDVTTGQEIKRIEAHLSLVSCVGFSSDGKYALSGGYDGTAAVWDLETGREVRRFDGPGKYVHAVSFSSDGSRVLIASDRVVRLFDRASGKELQTFTGHRDPVTAMSLSVNGLWLLTGSDDRTLRLWEVATGKQTVECRGHTGPVRDVAFAPSGQAFLSAGADRTVRLWQRSDGSLAATFTQHPDPVTRAVFLDEGRQTLSIGRDTSAKLWPLKKFESLVVAKAAPAPTPSATPAAAVAPTLKPSVVIPIGGTVGNLVLSPNRKWLFALDRTRGSLVQIATKDLKVTRELPLKGAEVFCLTRDGQTIATFTIDEGRTSVVLIDAIPLSIRTQFRIEAMPYDIAATDGGLLFLSGDGGGWADIAIVDARRQSIVGRWGGIWNRSVLALSADQGRLYVGSQGVSPGKFESFPLPQKFEEKPSATTAPAGDAPHGGALMVTPDGTFAIAQSGAVLRLSANATDDLRPVKKLPAHLAAAADPARGLLFLLAPDAQTVKQYSYPDLKWQRDHRLPGLAQHLAFDGSAGRLYATIIDPQALRDRPRARGYGDIHVYEAAEWLLPK